MLRETCERLKESKLELWLRHLTGTLPMLIGILCAGLDFQQNGSRHLMQWSLQLFLLFIWMKGWQGAFCIGFREQITGDHQKRTFGHWFKLFIHQGAQHSWGLLAIPIAVIIFLPLGWIVSYFQHLSVYCDSYSQNMRQRSFRACLKNPITYHFLLSWLSLFSTLVLLNVISAGVTLPYLIKILFGIDSMFTMGGISVFFNASFIAVIFMITYQLVDPLTKAVHVVWELKISSVQTGEEHFAQWNDIKRDWNQNQGNSSSILSKASKFVVLITISTHLGALSQGTLDAKQKPQKDAAHHLEQEQQWSAALDQALQKSDYQWQYELKNPKIKKNKEQNDWVSLFFENIRESIEAMGKELESMMERLTHWLEDVFKSWLKDREPDTQHKPNDTIPFSIGFWFVLFLGLSLSFLIILLLRQWKHIFPSQKEDPSTNPALDLNDHDIDASQLSSQGWLDLVQSLLDENNKRLALRACYLSTLSFLAQRRHVIISKGKGNREYAKELLHRCDDASIHASFQEILAHFEAAWYGFHDVSLEDVEIAKKLAQSIIEDPIEPSMGEP